MAIQSGELFIHDHFENVRIRRWHIETFLTNLREADAELADSVEAQMTEPNPSGAFSAKVPDDRFYFIVDVAQRSL